MAEYVEKPVKELIGDFYQAHANGDEEGMKSPLKKLQTMIFEGSLNSEPFIEYYNDMFSGRTAFNALISVNDYPFESIFRELLQNAFDCFYATKDVKIMVNFRDNDEISLSYNEIGFTMEQFLYYLAFGRNKLVQNKEVMTMRGTVLPLYRLGDLLNCPSAEATDEELYIVVVRRGERQIGLIVDQLIGQQEIVIKSLGNLLTGIPGIAGAIVAGDGNVRLIIDITTLI